MYLYHYHLISMLCKHNYYVFYFLSKRAMEEKKTSRAELKNQGKIAMQKIQEKNNTLEMYTKVLFYC